MHVWRGGQGLRVTPMTVGWTPGQVETLSVETEMKSKMRSLWGKDQVMWA